VMWFLGYNPYDTPYYGRNVAIAVIMCFFVLVAFIFIVNLIGFLLGHGGRQQTDQQRRTAQI